METPERRRGASGLEVREVAGAPVITGYAAVYNSETVIYGLWREQIAPGAFADAFTASADVRALWNHDTGTVLGRTTAGTLKLMDDDRGLKYAITVNTDDPMAMSVAAKIKRGDVNGSSFGFRVIDEEVDQEPTKKGLLPLVTIKAVELYEVCLLYTSPSPRDGATSRMPSSA